MFITLNINFLHISYLIINCFIFFRKKKYSSTWTIIKYTCYIHGIMLLKLLENHQIGYLYEQMNIDLKKE
ncbi:hypothetical protein LbFV_ORF86 [Leptopilina boulardi filamentous virus]|uniref:Uncharacterized protein n=1 Tax=Leptopilina boulardi filamentous virus TaxID=552509 RepID=A0A1S5YDD0_9VIRU|nr:hypothetical protein LbFV_ORF86 [Leptopilina boulardi filamentous virus]AQQ80006.1 hypothetical protein LbFV_ORF86 [Leptopilina boulardi filamentous virus]